MTITSLDNEKIKGIIKLQQKKYRDLENKYFIEGIHLVEEAYKKGNVEELYVLENEEINIDFPKTYISEDVMKKISTTSTPTKVIAVCKKTESKDIIGNRILLLDEIQDPGNLGTIIRSAVAFNIETIILSENTVD